MDDSDKSEPIDEDVANREPPPDAKRNLKCLNCGAPLAGKYCAQCGQKDLPRRQAIGDLSINFISSFFSFESKFFKTFASLLFKPGRIVVEYNEGKRERYYHPARMYVFLSFIFFLLFALLPDEDKLVLTDDGRQLTPEERTALLDTLNRIPWEQFDPKTIAEYDSIESTKPPGERDGWIERYFTKKFIELRQRKEYQNRSIWVSFGESFQSNVPRMVFLLLPVFALLLKMLYFRRDFYYSEHLVFSVFFYNFLFLSGIIGMLCSLTVWLEWLNIIIFFYVFFYLYKAMRNVYGQSRMKAVMKFIVLSGSFLIIILCAFLVNLLVTVIML